MKFIQLTFLAILSLSWASNVQSQVEPETTSETEKASVFQLVEVRPVFAGCEGPEASACTEGKILRHVFDQTRYPKSARDKGIQGTVFVKFLIGMDGKVTNVQTIRGVHPEIDSEAVKAVSSLPDFTPGMQNGKEVNVEYTLPIKFVLDDGAEDKKKSDQLEEEPKKKKRRKSKD